MFKAIASLSSARSAAYDISNTSPKFNTIPCRTLAQLTRQPPKSLAWKNRCTPFPGVQKKDIDIYCPGDLGMDENNCDRYSSGQLLLSTSMDVEHEYWFCSTQTSSFPPLLHRRTSCIQCVYFSSSCKLVGPPPPHPNLIPEITHGSRV